MVGVEDNYGGMFLRGRQHFCYTRGIKPPVIDGDAVKAELEGVNGKVWQLVWQWWFPSTILGIMGLRGSYTMSLLASSPDDLMKAYNINMTLLHKYK